MKRRMAVLLVAGTALAGAGPAHGDACVSTGGDERCEAWYSHADSPWGPDGFGQDKAQSMSVTASGVVVSGLTQKSSGTFNDYDYLTTGFDYRGSLAWMTRYDGGTTDIARGMGVSPDGRRIFVTGESVGPPGSGNDFTTVAYDAERGTRLWVARDNVSTIDVGRRVAVSPDGETVFVSGESLGQGSSYAYHVFAYEAATGVRLWSSRYDVTGLGWVADLGVSPSGDAVFVAGYWGGTDSGWAIAALDARDDDPGDGEGELGSLLWGTSTNPTSGSDRPNALAVSPSGDRVFVTGLHQLPGGPVVTYGLATAAYDTATGAQSWLTKGGGSTGSGIAVSADGTRVFVGGATAGGNAAERDDVLALAYDAANGQQAWRSTYGLLHASDVGRGVARSPDGSHLYVVAHSWTGAVGFQPIDWVTLAFDTGSGTREWTARFNSAPLSRLTSGPSGSDAGYPVGIGVAADGTRVLVGGTVQPLFDAQAATTGNHDYAAVAYNV